MKTKQNKRGSHEGKVARRASLSLSAELTASVKGESQRIIINHKLRELPIS